MSPDTLYRSHDFALHDTHHWEDWVELCCIANMDGQTDVASISDRFREERETRKEVDVEDDDSNEPQPQVDRAEEQDKQYLRVKKWFISLANRERLLGKNYPFELNPENSKLQLKANLTHSQRLYVALLMMSNLHYFNSSQSALTSSFETMGVEIFRWLLPPHADVHRFGKGSDNKGRYKGHIWKKIKQLADDLSCETNCKKEDFAPNDNGDAGLDLVGWVPWKDSAPGRLVLLGQCACTPDWAKKQDEASDVRWASKLKFITRPMTVILIPFFLRTPSGAWHRQTDFSGHLVIDRLRLLRTLSASAKSLAKLPAFAHVTNCLAAKESAY
jgi:hypothetical protein